MEDAYRDKALKKIAIYAILKQVKNGENTGDKHHLNPKGQPLVASVAATIEEDCCQSIKLLAAAHDSSVYTIIIHKDLGLEQYHPDWYLNFYQRSRSRREFTPEFISAVRRLSMAMLDNIVTMDDIPPHT
jgi:hypothetical protein